jgi:hypothetical protein
MNEKNHILKQLRAAGVKGKQKPFVASLPDDDLFYVFTQLQNGSSNRSIARALIYRSVVEGSENSVAQSIGKMKRRIEPLLRRAACSEISLPSPGKIMKSIDGLEPDIQLERIRRIEKTYGELIQQMIDECEDSALLPLDFPKHVTSLSTLVKIRMRMEEKAPKRARPQPISDAQFEADADYAMRNFVRNDGDKMIRMAQKFLDLIKEHEVELEYDENTGQYEHVEGWRKKGAQICTEVHGNTQGP